MVTVQEAPTPPVTGQLPKSIDVQDVLMRDVVAAKGIPVASECGRPIAPFRHPHKGRTWDPIRQEWVRQWRIEALVLSGDESGARAVVHLVNDPSEPHGWRAQPVFEGHSPNHIAVLRDSQGLFCVMIVAGKLMWSALGSDDTWATPSEFGKSGNTCVGLQVSYVHGRPFIVVPRRDHLSRYCLFGERGAWKESAAPAGAYDSALSVVPQGFEGHDQVVSAFVSSSNRKQIQFRWAPFGSELPAGDKFLEVGKEVHSVLAAHGQVFLLLNTDGTLATFRGELTRHPSDMTVRQMDHKVPADCKFSRVVTRISHEKAGQFWDIYALDTARRLWIIRQDRSQPTSPEGHPRFCPPVPVDTGVGGMDVSHDMYEESLIFSYAAKDGRLRLEVQDPRTRMWREIDVLPPTGATLLEKTVHRVEAVVRDQRGAPVPYTEVAVSSPEGAADCEIYWKDPRPGSTRSHPQMLTVTQGGVKLYSDHSGRVVFTLSADGLVARELLLKAGAAVTHARPGAKVLSYLKGSGTLRETDPRGPLPKFEDNGEALKHLNPQAEEETRKHAAYWMRQAATAGLRSEPRGIVALAAPEEITGETPGGWWGSFTHWAGDVWHSVSRGIATAANWVVRESKLVLDGVKWLGEEFVKGGKLVVAGMQQACHVVMTLFKKIVETAEKALHWLQAVLDFRAMWHTKCAFSAGMNLAFEQAQQRVTDIKQASDTWLDSKRDELRQRVKQARSDYRTVPLSTGTGQGTPGGKLREQMQDPTASWLYDKVQAMPPGELKPGGHPALETAWNDFRQNLDRFTEDGKKVGRDLVRIGGDFLSNPSSDKTVGDLLGLVGDIENTLLDVVKGFVDGAADLVNVGLSALKDVLNAELPVPDTLKTLWAWMVTTGGGNPANEPLNLANLIALLAAVPVTVVYKLANGNAEPFPNGKLPELNDLEGPDGSEAAKVCLFVSGILTAVSVLPAVTSDVMGTDAPTWVAAGGLVLSVLTITLANYTFLKGAAQKLSDPVAAICAAHLVEFVIGVVLVSLSRIQSAYQLAKKFIPLLTTALGLLGLLYYGYKAGKGKDAFPNVGTAVAGGLAALSPCTAFLKFETFRESEYAIPAKLFIDPLGLVGSGTLVAVNASPLAGT